jgi:hypothetical protein
MWRPHIRNVVKDACMPLQLEWDEKKRLKLLRKRDLDILDAALIFESPETVIEWEDNRKDYGERRFIAVGIAGETAYQVVYTWRGTAMRLITAWKITDDDYKEYKARKPSRAAEDEGSG